MGEKGGWAGTCPPKPFKIFADHATICNIHYAIFKPNPMQHLRWSSLWQKLGNGWKLLLTVVTWSFVLNVTWFLDLTLKCINLYQCNIVFHLPLTCSKSAKNTLEQHVTVNNKDTRIKFVTSIVNFEHILLFIL